MVPQRKTWIPTRGVSLVERPGEAGRHEPPVVLHHGSWDARKEGVTMAPKKTNKKMVVSLSHATKMVLPVPTW